MTDRRDAAHRYWIRHGCIRPTVGGITVAVFAAIAWYAGLLLDDRALMAAALTLTIIWGVALLLAIAQWALMRPNALAQHSEWVTPERNESRTSSRDNTDQSIAHGIRGACIRLLGRLRAYHQQRGSRVDFVAPIAVASRIQRILLPASVQFRRQFEQLDQDGRVVDRLSGALPQCRGWYRCLSVVARWHEPFNLFALRRVFTDDGEAIVLPEQADDSSNGMRAIDERLQGQSQTENAGSVRAYQPGDPPKLISWKQTAHRGTLMTRETGRDVRSTVIIVLDTRNDDNDPALSDDLRTLSSEANEVAGTNVISDEDVNAEVLAAWSLLRQPTNGGERRIVVTDGVRIGYDTTDAMRLLAACRPITPTDTADTAHGKDEHDAAAASTAVKLTSVVAATQSSSSASASSSVSSAWSSASSRADAVSQLAAEQQGVVSVLLLTPNPHSSYAQALRASTVGDRLRVQRTVNASSAQNRVFHDAVFHQPVVDAKPYRNAAYAKTAVPLSCVLNTLCLLVFFGVTLQALTSIISVNWWLWFAAAALAGISVEANIPPKTPKREVIRMVGVICGILMTCAVLTIIRIHELTGVWLFHIPDAQTASSDGVANGTVVLPSVWDYLDLVFSRSFDALIVQLPPVKVNALGDVLLVAVVAVVAIVMRCLLVWRRITPILALLPLATLAASFALVGTQSQWWQIGVLIVAFLLSLWAIHTERILPVVPVTASVVVTAMVLALTPAAVSFAYAVPLSIGESKGLLSANTINPMVDLKRSLEGGSDSIVMSYESRERRYLRMTTLDGFDGDTWSFDEDLAKDGGFYGSGIQLGRNADDNNSSGRQYGRFSASSWRQYIDSMTANPMVAYMSLMGIMPDGYSAGYSSDSTYGASMRAIIGTLSSRFLPVAGIPYNVTGATSGWIQYEDGTVYNRTDTTTPDMQYGSQGIYLDPISSDAGFQQISNIETMRETLIQQAQATTEQWNDRTKLRKQLAHNGAGDIHGNWLMIPLQLIDGYRFVDSNGEEVGTAQVDGIYTDKDGKANTAYDLGSFSDDFKKRVALSDDDMYGVAADKQGNSTLILSVENPEAVYSGIAAEQNANGDMAAYGMNTYLDAATQDMSSVCNALGLSAGGLSVSSMVNSFGYTEVADELTQSVAQNDKAVRSRYLALPDELPKEVTDIVAQAKAAGVNVTGSGYEDQVAAMRWLVDYFTNEDNGFTYSLDAPDGNGRDNMEMIGRFLESKAGYCAHYASALAVLGRAMGVPTRMVLGYNKGVGAANADGEYDVAAKQLHSWVEAYISGIGWIPFDVTPASVDNGSAESQTAANTDSNATQDQNSDSSPQQQDSAQNNDTQQDQTQSDTTQNEDQSNTETGNDTSKRQQTNGANTSVAAVALPLWAQVLMWLVLAAAILCALLATPSLIRQRRRRRRLTAIATAAAEDNTPEDNSANTTRAWFAAWQELCDTAWDYGVRWNSSDTERAIAWIIADALSKPDRDAIALNDDLTHISDELPDSAADENSASDIAADSAPDPTGDRARDAVYQIICRIADQIVAISFGALDGAPANKLGDDLATVHALFARIGTMQPPFVRLRRRLFPASLRRRM
ncbi:transglutaminase [Bifidobacterium goeldii]|uniref:Transglutaminase n=1 Tax=Bifidobacterium goeldii TaxID=2306975 RepID=A0A430FJ67_9BIFI|nr:transglutaminaseTgpA domain-containing protein [Bifidobacterium goeldii]RSX52899.1 transglutaminase [Bifidobacterium goeldii]